MELYKHAFDLSSDLVLFLDKDLSILWTNNAFSTFKKVHGINALNEFIDCNVLTSAIANHAILDEDDRGGVLTFDFAFKNLYFHAKFSCFEPDRFVLICHSTQHHHQQTIYDLTYTFLVSVLETLTGLIIFMVMKLATVF